MRLSDLIMQCIGLVHPEHSVHLHHYWNISSDISKCLY